MRVKNVSHKYILSLFIFISANSFAQDKKKDSLEVVKTLKELISICKNIDFGDPKTQQIGTFYKAAPYIIYRGEDEKRNWKDFAKYSNPKEKVGVDEVCYKINQTINQDSNYVIHKYHTETESEGKWHVLLVSYKKKGKEKKAAFAFLKIGKRYGLGDID